MKKIMTVLLLTAGVATVSQAAVESNLLADAGFEALDGAAPTNEPNDGDTPWNAIEVQPWIVAGRPDESHSGTQSVKLLIITRE